MSSENVCQMSTKIIKMYNFLHFVVHKWLFFTLEQTNNKKKKREKWETKSIIALCIFILAHSCVHGIKNRFDSIYLHWIVTNDVNASNENTKVTMKLNSFLSVTKK